MPLYFVPPKGEGGDEFIPLYKVQIYLSFRKTKLKKKQTNWQTKKIQHDGPQPSLTPIAENLAW